jgi:uncharacterized protein
LHKSGREENGAHSTVKRKWFRLTIGAAVVLALAVSTSACQPVERIHRYTFGSTSATSTHYTAAVVLANIINRENPDIKIDVVESGATHDNLVKTQAGELDGGFATNWDGMAMAYNGTTMNEYIAYGEWPELRILPGYLHTYVYVVIVNGGDEEEGGEVEPGEEIETLYDLHGRKFSAGIAGSVTELNIRRQFEALGIEPEWVSASYADVIEMARNGEIVGFARGSSSGGLDSLMLELHSEVGIRILGWPEEDLGTVLAAAPGTSATWIPQDSIADLSMPGFYTLGHTTGAFITTDIPQAVGYRMVKAYVDNWGVFAGAWPAAGNWTPLERDLALLEELIERVEMPPLHAGVVQLMVERGYAVPPELIGPEYNGNENNNAD